MRNYFEGWYFKQQNADTTLALIPGRSCDSAFIQVITNDHAYHVPFTLNQYQKGNIVSIGNNTFSDSRIEVAIKRCDLSLNGSLILKHPTPLSSDIMGPFRFLPMECRHSVISMNHTLSGALYLNGQLIDFTGGSGYIEGDSGTSFPQSYTWVQCNAFDDDCSVMASIAKIPFSGLKFWGCICSIFYRGQEYRLATYRGVKILSRSKNHLFLKQRHLKLLVEVPEEKGLGLYAPNQGKMVRTIHEIPSCTARFRFTFKDRLVFDKTSRQASFEHVE